jgi:Mrp family chromosome partitioning ATPase
MGRLLDALKRLEPELGTRTSAEPDALVADLHAGETQATQTAILEPPGEEVALPAPAAADAASCGVSEVELEISASGDDTEVHISFDAEEEEDPVVAPDVVEAEPFAEVSAEFDRLRQLLDEELPTAAASTTAATAEPLAHATVAPETVVSAPPAEEAVEADLAVPERRPASTEKATATAPESEKAASAFAAMARNVLAQLPVEGSAALLFTSPTDGEGKTETILPLAEALIAESGRRTILVDANLRHPALTNEWRVTSRKGIFDVLTGEADWWDAVQETGLPKLSILWNNGLPQENAIVAQPLAFSELLENLKREYPLVLVDAASLSRDESIPMVRCCEGVYLVVRLGHSTRRTVREARKVIGQAGGKLLGCIAVGGLTEAAKAS